MSLTSRGFSTKQKQQKDDISLTLLFHTWRSWETTDLYPYLVFSFCPVYFLRSSGLSHDRPLFFFFFCHLFDVFMRFVVHLAKALVICEYACPWTFVLNVP